MIHMIGNAHIDPVWLWQWQEGYQEIKATFKSALDRLSETDEFVFTCACAEYYRWVEENNPQMFEEISQRVSEGRWRIVGGMWIQPDCNMPSGESFARQFLYSQRYFWEKFGITAKTAYNVDSFGHAVTLPQIFKGAGIENYVMMRPGSHENADIPGPLFDWYAPDGSHVRTFRIVDAYSAPYDSCDKDIATALKWQKDTGHSMMCFYGVGNHGGGPTISNIKAIKAYQAAHPEDEVIFSSPDDYFESIKNDVVPEWKSELQHHASGCYSATSLIKMMNRKAENALLSAETMGVIGMYKSGRSIGDMTRGWQNLMFNQFHDVMCGCSIREAYEDARDQLGESSAIAAREQNAAVQSMSWMIDTIQGVPGRVRTKENHFRLWGLGDFGTPVVVFNPHAYSCKGVVQLFGNVARATDETGKEIPVQTVRASRTNNKDKWDTAFIAEVPAYGHRLYWVMLNGERMEADCGLKITETSLENENIAIRFDKETGAIVSIFDKAGSYEALSKPANLRLFDNEFADTWAHMKFTFDDPKGDFGQAEFKVIEEGPIRVKLRVTQKCNDSKIIQEFSLTSGSDQIDVSARLNMSDEFRMAKLCYPVNAVNPVALAEVAYGSIARPCDGCEESAQRWMYMGGDNGGLGVINNGKYSFSAPDNELRVTVANTSIYADHYGQDFRDDMCRHADIGEQEFKYAIVAKAGDWRELRLSKRGEQLNMPLITVVETYHEGPLGSVSEGIYLDKDNVLVGAFKRAEDGKGLVMRFSETDGVKTKCNVDIKLINKKFDVELKPYELKTLYIPDSDEEAIREILITEI